MVDRRVFLSAMQQDSRCRQLSGGERQGEQKRKVKEGGVERESAGESGQNQLGHAGQQLDEEARKRFLVAAVVLFVVSSRRLVCDAMRCHDVVVETLGCRMQKNGGRRRDRYQVRSTLGCSVSW